jgi:hypothetical protein
MKVTYEQFNTALVAALDAVSAGRGAEPRYRTAVLAFADSLGIEVSAWVPDGCTCRADARENCHAPDCQGGKNISYWVPRTWADVRVGDVVRMPGQEATAAEVMELATLGWHVNDIPPTQLPYESDHDYAKRVKAFNKDVQYRPNEHAGEWTARPVTLRPLAADDPAARHRIPNVSPGAPVEIRCTQVELDAIELLGGWSQRVAVAAPYPPEVRDA